MHSGPDWEWIARRLLVLGEYGYGTDHLKYRVDDPGFLTDEWLKDWYCGAANTAKHLTCECGEEERIMTPAGHQQVHWWISLGLTYPEAFSGVLRGTLPYPVVWSEDGTESHLEDTRASVPFLRCEHEYTENLPNHEVRCEKCGHVVGGCTTCVGELS
jgi:hypothetical protein